MLILGITIKGLNRFACMAESQQNLHHYNVSTFPEQDLYEQISSHLLCEGYTCQRSCWSTFPVR